MELKNIAEAIHKKEKKLQAWFQERAKGIRLPVTTSVDIRNAGFKIAVIDTNVFPSGFNNLCNNFSKTAALHFKRYLEAIDPKAKKMVIVPEAFTRNMAYFQHIKALETLLKMAGYEVAVGYAGEPLSQNPLEVNLPNGEKLLLEQLEEKNKMLRVASQTPDLILLNNDCSNGIPEILKNAAQPMVPSPELGWHSRSKKHHFEIYCQLTGEAAKILDLDCWRFCPITHCERGVDIHNPKDLDRVAEQIVSVLKRTQKKYDHYAVTQKPYVFIKNNAGTFGLGQMHFDSAEEFLNLNRKARQKLASSKGGLQPSEYLIQEGVPTIDSFEGGPIEPILYFVGGESVGGFFRIHEKKDNRESLNAPGSRFDCLCFHKIEEQESGKLVLRCEDHDDFFTIALWLGKVATLAVGLEEKGLAVGATGPAV